MLPVAASQQRRFTDCRKNAASQLSLRECCKPLQIEVETGGLSFCEAVLKVRNDRSFPRVFHGFRGIGDEKRRPPYEHAPIANPASRHFFSCASAYRTKQHIRHACAVRFHRVRLESHHRIFSELPPFSLVNLASRAENTDETQARSNLAAYRVLDYTSRGLSRIAS